ncbi:hypothetical protein HAHE_25470 [Haloferula helveola]|uniref:ABC-2 type transport system permease protein n=1 Tax=Haloferula helveola TaxID=490095 RepID=A0ABN6H7U5_9BACT|nr:hypothetical protein HAHE_25470 [Haloferula helveola]
MRIDTARLPRQLRYWSLHCWINALPSFLIALFYLELWESPLAILAMVLAICTFIVTYTVVTSIEGWFSNPDGLASRAVRIGAGVRMAISLISLPMLIPGVTMLFMFTPDFWAGWFAVMLVNGAAQSLGASSPVLGPGGDGGGFLSVFATTLIEGATLSLMLAMFAFFALVILQIRARRRGVEIPASV